MAARVSAYLRHRRAGKTDTGFCYFKDSRGRRRQRSFPGAFGSAESRRAYHAFARSALSDVPPVPAKQGESEGRTTA